MSTFQQLLLILHISILADDFQRGTLRASGRNTDCKEEIW